MGSAFFEHRLILSGIGQKLGKEDLDEVLFLCEAFISESTAEETHSATALFRELEHRTLLGPGKYGFLKTVLMAVGRVDLAHQLPQANSKRSPLLTWPSAKSEATPSPLAASKRSLLLVVAESLRKRDLQKLAFLCSRKFSDGMSLIEELEDEGLITGDSCDYLALKLVTIGRRDLSTLLNNHGFNCDATAKTTQEDIASW